MRTFPRPLLRLATLLGALALVVAGLVLPAAPAAADTRPSVPGEPVTVSADPLPTVQINGVVWQQVIIGNTVYAAGSFSTARPAGAAPGTSTVPRSNLLAYDIRTGNLLTSFAPTTNAQVMAITASPDGSRLYIGGDFTQVNGATVWRVAALNPTTGALITSFLPRADSRVRAIAATEDTVYLGGTFSSVTSQARSRAAAVRASDGALLPWAPRAENGSVFALLASPDRSRVVIGGSFTSLSGSTSPGYGLAAVHATTGAVLPFAANAVIRNGGPNGAINNLTGDGDYVYGTGYTVGRAAGTLEGTFAARWDGTLHWVEDCHGDSYAVWPQGDIAYTVSHKHYCGNIGGFPQRQPFTYYHSTVVTKAATGTATREQWGYTNFQGLPVPTMLNWYPTWGIGTYTGQSQAAWAVTATDSYVVIGGEFPTVNGTPQQGLVRFAIPSIAPNRSGPVVSGAPFDMTGSSPSAGVVRLQWTANHDRDNRDLTYELTRNGSATPPIHSVTQRSTFYDRPPMGYFDTGLPPGSTQRYRLRAVDPWGNLAWTDSIDVTVSGTPPVSSRYADAVLADDPQWYWRLGETSGNRAFDRADFNDMTVTSGVTRGITGALAGDGDRAATFDGTSAEVAAARTDERPGNLLTIEAWIRTTTTRGGKIVGLGDANVGTSILVDRHLYMDNAGRVFFGVRPAAALTVHGTRSYNDGQWHHVAATLGTNGMRLYVDGAQVASRTDVTTAAPVWGYWRIGGDRLQGWDSDPTSDYFTGSIDEVAVYDRTLSAASIANHHQVGRTAAGNLSPTAAFTATVSGLTAQVDGRASSDPDGSVVGHAWDFGDGGTASGATASHTYATAGTYSVRLTVTDDDGATATVVQPVTVTAPPPGGVVASDTFGRTVVDGWGTADFGGAWSLLGTPSRFSVAGGTGRMAIPGGAGGAAYLAVSAAQSDLTGAWSVDRRPNAGAAYLSFTGRRVGSDDYRAKIRVGTDGALVLYLTRVVGGAETTLATAALPGLTVQGGDRMRVRLQALGSSPTVLNARVWRDGTPEPATWQVTASDGSAGLQAAGGVGVVTYLSSSATNGPMVFAVDDLVVTSTGSPPPPPPPGNEAPVAAFTEQVSGLGVQVDGSGSSDPDGSVVGYAWDFGDGGTASGVTASHSYAAAGSYPVRLTVTDDDAATGTVVRTVTVASPPPGGALAADAFERTVSNGWGTADTGGAWTLVGTPSRFSVSGGEGRLAIPVGGGGGAVYLDEVASTQTDLTLSVTLDAVPVGGGVFVSFVGRRVGTQEYRTKVRITPDGMVVLYLVRAAPGSEATLAVTAPAGISFQAGDRLRIRMQATGTSPTTLSAKVWESTQPEPADWQLTSSDSTAGLQASGGVGVFGYVAPEVTGLPVVLRVDDLAAQAP